MAANREATSGFGTIAGILFSTVPDTSMKVGNRVCWLFQVGNGLGIDGLLPLCTSGRMG